MAPDSVNPNYDRALIGFYLSGHPLSKYKKDIELFCKDDLSPDTIRAKNDREEITIGAIITDVKRLTTKKKNLPFAFIQVEDLKGTIEVMVFNKVYDHYLGFVQEDNIVQIKGTISRRDGATKIIADSFDRIENLREDNQRRLKLNLDFHTDQLTTDDLKGMARLFEKNQGQTPVQLNVISPEANAPIKMSMRKYVVEPNDEVLDELTSVLGPECIELRKTQK